MKYTIIYILMHILFAVLLQSCSNYSNAQDTEDYQMQAEEIRGIIMSDTSILDALDQLSKVTSVVKSVECTCPRIKEGEMSDRFLVIARDAQKTRLSMDVAEGTCMGWHQDSTFLISLQVASADTLQLIEDFNHVHNLLQALSRELWCPYEHYYNDTHTFVRTEVLFRYKWNPYLLICAPNPDDVELHSWLEQHRRYVDRFHYYRINDYWSLFLLKKEASYFHHY